MAIEILGYPSRPVKDTVDSAAAAGGPAGKAASRPAAATSARTDQVSLTTSAALLKELEKEIAQLPVVDTRRVEDVQRSLATGTLQIDPPRIANKLLQLELIMSGKD
jgi:negative regulator of flagellin synthesis FlgM